MPCSDLDRMSYDQLKKQAGALLWQLRLADAFWFINIEKKAGLGAAEEVNAAVWEKVGRMAAKDIVERFDIREKGIQGFMNAFKHFSWSLMIDYQVQLRDNELLLTVPSCPAQEGRKKHGLGEYSCKDMHLREFTAFATEIDPDIRVDCLFAPPDRHPPDVYCKWRIYVSGHQYHCKVS